MRLETPVYGGPYNIEASNGEVVRLNNILIGGIWLYSGQFNMDVRMEGCHDEPVIGPLDATVTSRNS